VNYRIRL